MRPIFLVIDPPDPEALSTRKLVLESAKFNVLTAFTSEEALEIADSVPLQATILHEGVEDGASTEQIAGELKKRRPEVPVFVLTPHPHDIANADRVLSSHDPIELVRFLQETFKLPKDPERLDPRMLQRQRP